MSYWIYVLIGDNDTGKTSFQKHLLEHLCGKIYEKLVTNQVYDVIHPRAPKSFKTIFIANRSYQEKAAQYGSPKQYYEKYVKTADVTILASHVHPPSPTHIAELIALGHGECYNVAGVFFENATSNDESRALPWDERLWIANRHANASDKIQEQLKERAIAFGDMLIERSRFQ